MVIKFNQIKRFGFGNFYEFSMIGVSNNLSKYKITVYHFSQVLYDLYEHYLFF
jgi:hypothetical protein